MKRAFVFKDEKSDKFWSIDCVGCDFAVNFGKTGTSGRYQVKEFGSAEECLKEARKLVSEKERKGYVEDPSFDFDGRLYFDDEEVGPHRGTSHPAFRVRCAADFYYDCTDEAAPFGSDEGADVLADLEEAYRKKGRAVDVADFPRFVVEDEWEMEYLPPSVASAKLVESDLGQFDGERLECMFMSDQVILAAAFGQIKITGALEEALETLATGSARRLEVVCGLLGYPNEHAKTMRNDLLGAGASGDSSGYAD